MGYAAELDYATLVSQMPWFRNRCEELSKSNWPVPQAERRPGSRGQPKKSDHNLQNCPETGGSSGRMHSKRVL
jgi:hypothetical protein